MLERVVIYRFFGKIVRSDFMSLQPERSKRALVDVNGGILVPKKGYESHKVTVPLDDTYLNKLNEFKKDFNGVSNLESSVRNLLGGKPFWSILKNSDPVGGIATSFQSIWGRIDRIMAEAEAASSGFFNRYIVSNQEVKGLELLNGENVKNTLYSGIPYGAKHLLYENLERVWNYLDAEQTAILLPNQKYSGVHLKTTVALLLGKFEDVYPIEDDFYVALCLAGSCNTRVYMPISEVEARKQSHLRELPLPASLHRSTNGDIVFNAGTHDVYAEIVSKNDFYQK